MKTKINAFNYDYKNINYSCYRKPDPRICEFIFKELKSEETILNVGAGSGSYEPDDKYVIAIEPSKNMRLERNEKNKRPAINGIAEKIPFEDNSFDSSMAILTVHHWKNLEIGLHELMRVSRH